MCGKRPSRWSLSILIGIAILVLAYTQPVWADAAPPARPPGASVGPGEAVTQVQMVSEEVMLEIKGQDAAAGGRGLAADQMLGHVEAVFVMRNQGETEEAFDVWFPLGAPDGYFNVTTVTNFAAWVDGQPAKLGEALREGEWESTVPWAIWPVTFPPGQDVVLRVAYDVLPDGYSPFGTFPYVLETGAGWWGPIGEGTIIFRLPYDVNETNTVLNPDVYAEPQIDWRSPNPIDYEVSGTDVVWRFTDLEPTAEDNVHLTVLPPSVWQGMVTARKEAAAQPDSLEAQLRLAQALGGGLYFRHGLDPVGNSVALAREAQSALKRALELAPQDVDVYVAYLDWLQLQLVPGLAALPEDFRPVLEQALELDPDHERLLALQIWLVGMEPYLVTATPTPGADATATPTRRPTPAPRATATPMPTVTHLSTKTPSPTATKAPSPTVEEKPTPTAATAPSPTVEEKPIETASPSRTVGARPTATATIAPERESGSGGVCRGTVMLALVPLSVLIWRKRRASDGETWKGS